jgi:hypothetical protein
MSDDQRYRIGLFIDDLTNSIRHVDSGKSFETDIFPLATADMKLILKKDGWQFSWKTEVEKKDRFVFKLVRSDVPGQIQGLISLSDMPGFVYVHLAESAPMNFGKEKTHEGVGGNLFAYACKRSWDSGNDGFVSFQAKTRLINHYETALGAVHNGGHNMIIYPRAALFLIRQYFNV